MKSMTITSNRSEDTMLVRGINWRQHKNLMENLGREGVRSNYGHEVFSVRVMDVKKFSINVEKVKRWCRAS